MNAKHRPTALAASIVGILLLAPAAGWLVLGPKSDAASAPQQDGTSSNAANKAAVSGSDLEQVGPLDETVLLSAEMKTSTKADLILQVTFECALWTEVTTVGNDLSEARASVVAWVEVDGKPVLVSDDDQEDGRVVFCNRIHRQTTSDFDDENATINTFLATRSANAFNWVLFDAGSGTHTIELKAKIEGDTVGTAFVQGAVGARTMVVEKLDAAQGQ